MSQISGSIGSGPIGTLPIAGSIGSGFAPDLTLEALVLGDSCVAAYGVKVLDRIRLSNTLNTLGTFHVIALEHVKLRETLITVFEAIVVEAVELADVLSAVRATLVHERVAIAAIQTGNRVRMVIARSGFGMSDQLLQHIAASVVEGLALDTSLDTLTTRIAEVVEALQLGGSAAPQFILYATAQESIELNAQQLLTMVYSGKIIEGVEIGGGFVGPDGTYTAWTMNVETGAVSEYTNYEFNSFARMGNVYYGASADGLYQLLGDDDDGDDIIATLRGGYMQFGGTHLSRLKAAYIAVRGDGDFVLKIETAEGQTYNYGVIARDMRTTKVHMGKGQRARYFAFELTSDGQDFDFESLEFVPIVVQRRV